MPEQDTPWVEKHWSNAANFAHDHYRPGGFAPHRQLEQEGSPLRIDLLDGRGSDGTIGTVRSGYALSPLAERAGN